jgi:hypothetical protein
VSAILADGWSVTYPSPPAAFAPDSAPETVTLTRQGFDAAGQAVSLTEALTLTKRVRQPYPNHAQLSTDRAALSDYVYATDTIVGAANNSVEASPKPIANWIMPHRLAVANAVRLEVVAAHRNARAGRQAACVKFIASDGTNMVSQTVSATTVSGRTGDRNAVVCFQCDLDVSALNAGLITVNAEVYPWVGGAASVAKSASDGNAARGFSPRYFLKTAAAKVYAYLSTTGNDSTGLWHADAATAAATPFLTQKGAFDAIDAARNSAATGSKTDLLELRVGSGTFDLGTSAAARAQNVAAVTITRDPSISKSNAIVRFGTGLFRPKLQTGLTAPLATGAVRFHDLTVQRNATTNALTGEAAANLEIIFDNVAFDGGALNASWLANAHDHHFGTTFTNLSGNSSLGATTGEHRILRGILADLNFGQMEGWLVVGSQISRSGPLTRGTRSFSGGMVAFNSFRDPTASTFLLDPAVSASLDGFALVQNLVEYVSAAATASFGVSADGATGSNSHVVVHNNSFTGFNTSGRQNLFYDDGATARTARLQSVKANIFVQINTKSDVFTADGSRTGNWGFLYGAGCEGNFSQFIDAQAGGIGGSFAQAYPGLRARIGTSATMRNDPLFTSYAGTGSGPAAGTGGGTYTLQAGSPARGLAASATLSHDLGGAVRPAANDSAGAFA